MTTRVPLPPLVVRTQGHRQSVDVHDPIDGVIRTPVSGRSQAANDAHALAIIQWHTTDRELYLAVTPDA